MRATAFALPGRARCDCDDEDAPASVPRSGRATVPTPAIRRDAEMGDLQLLLTENLLIANRWIAGDPT
jgi:hypothetical protein